MSTDYRQRVLPMWSTELTFFFMRPMVACDSPPKLTVRQGAQAESGLPVCVATSYSVPDRTSGAQGIIDGLVVVPVAGQSWPAAHAAEMPLPPPQTAQGGGCATAIRGASAGEDGGGGRRRWRSSVWVPLRALVATWGRAAGWVNTCAQPGQGPPPLTAQASWQASFAQPSPGEASWPGVKMPKALFYIKRELKPEHIFSFTTYGFCLHRRPTPVVQSDCTF